MFNPDAVPFELFVKIFSYLPNDDLAEVSLVCRGFRTIAEPLLYSHPRLTGHNDRNIPQPLQDFIQRILARPILANYVRSLEVEWGDDPVDIGPQNMSNIALFAAASRSVGLWPLLESRAGAGDDDGRVRRGGGPLDLLRLEGVHVVLLLYLLPNLQFFKFSNTDTFDIFQELLTELSFLPSEALPAGLRSLRDIRCSFNDGNTTTTPLTTILSLPSIRRIRFRVTSYMSEHGPSPTADPRRSSVTNLNLSFRHDIIPTPILARILAMPMALTHFTFVDHPKGAGSFDCGEFRRGLATSRNTLQYLRLTIRMALGIIVKAGTYEQTIGSLHDWPVLRSVRCPLGALLGKRPEAATARLVDVLPTVITDFCIDTDWYWRGLEVAEKLREMVDDKGVYGPDQLRAVTAIMCWGHEEESEEILRAAFNDAGVALTLRSLVFA